MNPSFGVAFAAALVGSSIASAARLGLQALSAALLSSWLFLEFEFALLGLCLIVAVPAAMRMRVQIAARSAVVGFAVLVLSWIAHFAAVRAIHSTPVWLTSALFAGELCGQVLFACGLARALAASHLARN